MGFRQACKIIDLKEELKEEKEAHKRTIRQTDKLKRSKGSGKYSFYYVDAYGCRILKDLTYEQAEALTGWITTRHNGYKCSRCRYATDDSSLVYIDMEKDTFICPECQSELRVFDAPSPPEPWGNGEWVERGCDPLSSIWVGLQGRYPEFDKARWLERHGDEMIDKGLRQDIKNLKKRLKRLECNHSSTEVKRIRSGRIHEICKACGKKIATFSEAEYLARQIDDFVDEEVSDGNGIIKSVQKLRDANEKLKIAISDAEPDA